jgi:hypothetical protein
MVTHKILLLGCTALICGCHVNQSNQDRELLVKHRDGSERVELTPDELKFSPTSQLTYVMTLCFDALWVEKGMSPTGSEVVARCLKDYPEIVEKVVGKDDEFLIEIRPIKNTNRPFYQLSFRVVREGQTIAKGESSSNKNPTK